MSKKSKAFAKLENLQNKRKRKASNKARYEQLRISGQNSKSTRARRNAKKGTKLKGTHPFTPCGNPACKKCFRHIPGRGVYSR